ncbi:FxSxx-COOH system tetratricopeptide repeat protein [Paucibacter sp. PLA-PC-4]|uniref:FxSxx-COOH system tetratricopeptide repeat protein n=1 Tax=Paucibacter sp. PLA-PC-4 TaxID=2993655 RepID=UPI002248C9A5|nr:FxSxx-COOH system tetratricopeptide repeat protein [Paucibacter sp. PLA-PC-4]MCX2862255.1 FxSxx-COOH system tetratricopeptide repeat protein [Paucibacter sp. PLA-PC-4]
MTSVLAWIVAVERHTSGTDGKQSPLDHRAPISRTALAWAEWLKDKPGTRLLMNVSAPHDSDEGRRLEALRPSLLNPVMAAQAGAVALHQSLKVVISGPRADVLLLLWTGHGVMHGRDRFLIHADSLDPKNLHSWEVDSLLQYLRDDSAPPLQIGVFDTCAEIREQPGHEKLVGGSGKGRRQQFFHHASAAGAFASLGEVTVGGLALESMQQLEWPPEPKRLHELLLPRIEGLPSGPHLLERTTGSGDAWSSVHASSRITNLPTRNVQFAGRDDWLTKIHSDLAVDRPIVVAQAIAGLGGIGKTQLALEYAHRHEHDYQIVWWVKSETRASREADLLELYKKLEPGQHEGQPVAASLAALRRCLESNRGWLLVFDNVEKPDDIRNLLPVSNRGHVLITSRFSSWGSVAATLSLPVWSVEESVQYLRQRTGRPNDPDAAELADRLGNLPLALEQAAAYVEESQVSIRRYCDLLRDLGQDLIGSSAKTAISTIWKLSLEAVQERSHEAVALLQLMAFLPPDEVTRSRLVGASLSTVPDQLRDLLSDELHLNDAVAVLRSFSLINATPETLSVHRLVQVVVKERLSLEDHKTYSDAAHEIQYPHHIDLHDVTDPGLENVPLLPKQADSGWSSKLFPAWQALVRSVWRRTTTFNSMALIVIVLAVAVALYGWLNRDDPPSLVTKASDVGAPTLAQRDVDVVPPPPVTKASDVDYSPTRGTVLPAAMLTRREGQQVLRSERKIILPLDEPSMPGPLKHAAGSAADRIAALRKILDWLDVENSARYRQTNSSGFPNVYAHDYAWQAGAYIPRVWWTSPAIMSLHKGIKPDAKLGSTVKEMRANDLCRWLVEHGNSFGWRSVQRVDDLQIQANDGRIALICARRREDGKAGHMTLVVPESSEARAIRGSDGVVSPVQSQAGAKNYKYGAPAVPWWTNELFTDVRFWVHPGPPEAGSAARGASGR